LRSTRPLSALLLAAVTLSCTSPPEAPATVTEATGEAEPEPDADPEPDAEPEDPAEPEPDAVCEAVDDVLAAVLESLARVDDERPDDPRDESLTLVERAAFDHELATDLAAAYTDLQRALRDDGADDAADAIDEVHLAALDGAIAVQEELLDLDEEPDEDQERRGISEQVAFVTLVAEPVVPAPVGELVASRCDLADDPRRVAAALAAADDGPGRDGLDGAAVRDLVTRELADAFADPEDHDVPSVAGEVCDGVGGPVDAEPRTFVLGEPLRFVAIVCRLDRGDDVLGEVTVAVDARGLRAVLGGDLAAEGGGADGIRTATDVVPVHGFLDGPVNTAGAIDPATAATVTVSLHDADEELVRDVLADALDHLAAMLD
jgi:hypothetical protein